MKSPKVRHWSTREASPITKMDPSKTVQSEMDNTDINEIVSKFRRTGELPGEPGGQYADVSGMNQDLTTLLQQQKEITERIQKHEQSNANATATPQTLENQTAPQVETTSPPAEGSEPNPPAA